MSRCHDVRCRCQMSDVKMSDVKMGAKAVIAYVLSRTVAEGARVIIAKRIILQKEGNGELTVRRI